MSGFSRAVASPAGTQTSAGPDTGLSVEGLTKLYGSLVAVDGISFRVRRGETFGSLGPPASVAPVVNSIPLTHLNDALREVVNHGGGLGDLWLSWTIPAAWIVSGFVLSIRLFRWQ